MGLFDFLRKQYRKVIQWENDNPQSIVWKYPLERKEEIMRNSVLVVREGQKAMFIQEGKLADVFGPGTYKLEDIKNIPLLTALYNWKYFWETPYTGDIYFISTKQFIDNKWGTSNPVMMRDKEFGMVRVRGFGVYSFSVGTPTAAMNELFGSMGELTVKDVDDYFKKIIVSELSTAIAESGIPAIDLAMHYDELSDITRQKMAEDFAKIGIEIDALYIENISLRDAGLCADAGGRGDARRGKESGRTRGRGRRSRSGLGHRQDVRRQHVGHRRGRRQGDLSALRSQGQEEREVLPRVRQADGRDRRVSGLPQAGQKGREVLPRVRRVFGRQVPQVR